MKMKIPVKSSHKKKSKMILNCRGNGACFDHGDGPHGFIKRAQCSCELISCPNKVLCGRAVPEWLCECFLNMCPTCGVMFGLPLGRQYVVKVVAEHMECPVCYEDDKVLIEFPAECGHGFCAGCTKKLMTIVSKRDGEMSPVPYGCPVCPNGCQNPTIGVQCRCRENLVNIAIWMHANPDVSDVWSAMNELSQRQVIECVSLQSCPMCRKQFV
jgi:hypothetical protein